MELKYGILTSKKTLHAALENVQKFALRFCFKKWSSSYQDLLHLSKLQSLQDHRSFLSLTTAPFKIIQNIVIFHQIFFPLSHLLRD